MEIVITLDDDVVLSITPGVTQVTLGIPVLNQDTLEWYPGTVRAAASQGHFEVSLPDNANVYRASIEVPAEFRNTIAIQVGGQPEEKEE